MEIVTEPDLRSAEQAHEWLTLLRTTLRAARRLGRQHGGGLAALRRQRLGPPGRLDRARDQDRAEEHELVPVPRARASGPRSSARSSCCESGEAVVQETLHFDPATGRLTPLRSKEEAHDYRYFPEPDLVPLVVTEEMLAAARAALPELPAGARAAVRARARAQRRARARAGVPPRAGRLLRAGAAPPTARPARSSSPTGSRSWSSGSAPTPTRPTPRSRPEALADAGGDGRRQAGQPRRRPRGADHAGRTRAATRGRSSSARAWARSATTTATSSARSSTARSPPTPTPPRRCAAAT